MKYLKYLLTAHTAYNLHSPYVFHFYNEIINSKIDKHIMHPPLHKWEQVIYKIANTFCPKNIYIADNVPHPRVEQILREATGSTPCYTKTEGANMVISQTMPHNVPLGQGAIVILYHPQNNTDELRKMRDDDDFTISIDLYHIAIGMYRLPHLSKQHFVLR